MSLLCPKCNRRIPVNGPWRRLHCGECLHTFPIAESLWSYLDGADDSKAGNEYERGGADLMLTGERLIWRHTEPKCSCGASLPVQAIGTGRQGQCTCDACGAELPLMVAPPWLCELAPSVTQLYNADPEPEIPSGTAVAQTAGAGPLVALSCPSCGGGLNVSSQSARIFPCEYCGVDVLMHDAAWAALHPRLDAKVWFARFDGKSRCDVRREREESAEAVRSEQERQREREAEQRLHAQQVEERAALDARLRRSRLLTLIVWLLVGATFAFAWLFLRTPARDLP